MKTYLIPTPASEILRVTQADNPEAFKEMEVAAKTLEPITQIAHMTYFETFCLLDVDPSKEVDVYEMLEAGVFLGSWLDIQSKRFESEKQGAQ